MRTHVLGIRYHLKWMGHEEVAYDTQEAVDVACDRMCDVIEIEMSVDMRNAMVGGH